MIIENGVLQEKKIKKTEEEKPQVIIDKNKGMDVEEEATSVVKQSEDKIGAVLPSVVNEVERKDQKDPKELKLQKD